MTYRAFFDSAPDAMVIADKRGVIRIVNAQVGGLFGYRNDELVGEPIELLLPERFRALHLQHIRNFFSDPRPRKLGLGTDLFGLTKDGLEIPVEISLRLVDNVEDRLVVAAVRDISVRKKEMLQTTQRRSELQRELAQVSRLAAMGQVSTRLAHELNQPLTAMVMHCESALSLARANPQICNEIIVDIAETAEQAHRAGAIVRELRQFIRDDSVRRSTTQINTLVTQTMQLLEPDIQSAQINVRLELDEPLPEVFVDRGQIALVMVSLTRNSIAAIVDGSCQRRLIEVATSVSNGRVVFRITDSGPGLDPGFHLHTHVEPASVGRSGIGLTMSQSLIGVNDGKLWAAMDFCDGARFFFSLPVAKS